MNVFIAMDQGMRDVWCGRLPTAGYWCKRMTTDIERHVRRITMDLPSTGLDEYIDINGSGDAWRGCLPWNAATVMEVWLRYSLGSMDIHSVVHRVPVHWARFQTRTTFAFEWGNQLPSHIPAK